MQLADVRSHKDSGRQHLWALGSLAALAGLLFAGTVALRAPSFGVISNQWYDNSGHHQWLTASTLLFLKDWYNDGMWHLGGMTFYNPPSIEFATPASRSVYFSYPPGCLLPIHAWARLTAHEPDVPMIMRWNLASQLAVALMLAGAVYLFAVRAARLGIANAWALAAIPIVIVLLLPGPLYFFQHTYYSIQPVLPLFALLLLLQLLRTTGDTPSRFGWLMRAAQAAVVFCGVFTDWLFVPVTGVFILVDMMARPPHRSRITQWSIAGVTFALPAFAAVMLYGCMLTSFWGSVGTVLTLFRNKLAVRRGIDSIAPPDIYRLFVVRFWGPVVLDLNAQRFTAMSRGFVAACFGAAAVPLLWAALALVPVTGVWWWRHRHETESARHRMVGHCAAILAFTTVPCFFYTHLLAQNSFSHSVEALKFVVPLAVGSLVAAPLAIAAMFGVDVQAWAIATLRFDFLHRVRLRITLPGMLFVGSAAYAIAMLPGYRMLVPPVDRSWEQLGDFFSRTVRYQDIVCSPCFDVPPVPPFGVAYLFKPVHRVASLDDIAAVTGTTTGDFSLCLFSNAGDLPLAAPPFAALVAEARTTVRTNALVLHRISKETLTTALAQQATLRAAATSAVDPPALYRSAFDLYRAGLYRDSALMLDRVHVLTNSFDLSRFLAGWDWQVLGDSERAIREYRIAAQTMPDYLQTYMNLGIILLQRSAYAEATNCFMRCLTLDPGNAAAQQNLQECLRRLRK